MAGQSKLKIVFIALIAIHAIVAAFLLFTKPGRQWFKSTQFGTTIQASCDFKNPSACPADEVCVQSEGETTECVKRFVGHAPFIRFPFPPEHPVMCTQGPQSVVRGHSFETTLFAIDLATPSDSGPGTVYAVTEGTALVYRSCANGTPSSPGKLANDDPCGAGFGNHIRILNPRDGIMVMYAHLGPVWIEDGQVVRIGDKLGQEGQSGRAGHRHLHFSVHAFNPKEWLQALNHYRSTPGTLPQSIPFETQFCDPIHQGECVRRRSRVEKLPCSSGVPGSKDFGKSAGLLRADWRE